MRIQDAPHRITCITIERSVYRCGETARRIQPRGRWAFVLIIGTRVWDCSRLLSNLGRWGRFMPSLPTEETRDRQIL